MPTRLLKTFLFVLSVGIIIFFLEVKGIDLNFQVDAQSPEISNSIDLSDLVADTDLNQRKSILYMENWPKAIEKEKVLYIPSTGIGKVYICPNAKSLEEVNPNCENKIILNLGETKQGMTLGLTEYEGREYYAVYGIKGTGGGEVKEVNLAEKIEIIKINYGGVNILNCVASKVGDNEIPLLLSELQNNLVDLEECFVKENKGKKSKGIAPRTSKKLKMKFKFLETAGNEYQGKSIKVRFKFKGIQER